MDAGGDRTISHLNPSNVAVIREVYDGEYSQQCFSMELEKALTACCAVIVIEPAQLGDETARWIAVGNGIHKTSVAAGICSILSGIVWPHRHLPQVSLSAFATLCACLYTVSWQLDHCVKYQVEQDPRRLARMPVMGALTAASPVVLIRKDDTPRIIFHWAVAITATAFFSYRLFRSK